MRQPPMHVMTANRLSDGAVVYLGAEGQWAEQLRDAKIAATQAGSDELETTARAAVGDRLIVGPYLFAVETAENGSRPISQREHIRSLGPTVGTDLSDTREGA